MDSGVGPSGLKRSRSMEINARLEEVARARKKYCGLPSHQQHLVSRTMADNYTNYVYSGLPRRIMLFETTGWMELPAALAQPFIAGFRERKSSVNFCLNGERFLLLDFVAMVLVNLRTGKLQSVAWVDETGKNYFPNTAILHGAAPIEIEAWVLSCGGQAHGLGNFQAQECEAPILLQPLLYPVVARLKRNSARYLGVQEMFLSGMGPFATSDSVLDIFAFNGRLRQDAFVRQIGITARFRGNANVKYAWYGSTDNNIVDALINGFSHSEDLCESGILGRGIYLTPQDRAFASVRVCEVGRDGVQHMLLCRVILGNVEQTRLGTTQHTSSNRNFDLGVDNIVNPKRYIVWSTHLGQYIHPTYLVRFELTPRIRDYLCGLKDIRYHMEEDKVWYEISGQLEPYLRLYEELREEISPWAQRLFLLYIEEFKRNKLSRQALNMKVTSIVQELLPGPELAARRQNESAAVPATRGQTSAHRAEDPPADTEVSTVLTLAIGGNPPPEAARRDKSPAQQ